MNNQDEFDLEILHLFSQAGADGLTWEMASELKGKGFEFDQDDVDAACERLAARGLIEPVPLRERVDQLLADGEAHEFVVEELMTEAIRSNAAFKAADNKYQRAADQFENVRDNGRSSAEKIIAAADGIRSAAHELRLCVETLAKRSVN